MIKRNNLLLVFLFSSHFLFSQTLKEETPTDSPIDVIEQLGNYIPLDTTFINESTAFANQKKKNYIAGYNLKNVKNDWHFLTGDQENIKKIADSIGFIYYYDEDRDEYMHPAAISVLSPEGKISRYLYGIQFLAKDLKLSLLEAGEGKIGSTLDKIVLYCYHYDPYKNTYTLFATNIMRLGGILQL